MRLVLTEASLRLSDFGLGGLELKRDSLCGMVA